VFLQQWRALTRFSTNSRQDHAEIGRSEPCASGGEGSAEGCWRSLAGFGITLLDDITVNEQFEWWSLHERSAGTTAWGCTEPDATTAAAISAFKEPRRSRPQRRST